MEIFLIAALSVLVLSNVLLSYFLHKKIQLVTLQVAKQQTVFYGINQSLSDLRDSLKPAEPVTPIKSNNWLRMREVFKGPARVVDDRD